MGFKATKKTFDGLNPYSTGRWFLIVGVVQTPTPTPTVLILILLEDGF